MAPAEFEPGSECPGSLQTWSYAVASGDFRRRHRCPVCGARWRADGFHGEFRRLPARVTRSPFQQTSDADGVRQMKIRIGANEKMGKDGYGSYGSSIELEISRDDELTVDQVCSDVAAWQTILDRLVQQDMARKAAALPPKPEQRPQSRLEGRPSAARQPEPEGSAPAERPPGGGTRRPPPAAPRAGLGRTSAAPQSGPGTVTAAGGQRTDRRRAASSGRLDQVARTGPGGPGPGQGLGIGRVRVVRGNAAEAYYQLRQTAAGSWGGN